MPYYWVLGPGRSIRRWTHSQGWGLPGGCQTVTSQTKWSLLRSMLSLQWAQPRHMEREGNVPKRLWNSPVIRKWFLHLLIRLTLELYTTISFLKIILQVWERITNLFHHIRSLNSQFFSRHTHYVTSQVTNATSLPITTSRQSTRIEKYSSHNYNHRIILTRSLYERFHFW